MSCHGGSCSEKKLQLCGIVSGSPEEIPRRPDLSDVIYIDSGGLGTLVGVYSSARAAGADIKLTGLGQRLRDVLQITKLATVFQVFDTEQEELAALGRGAA
jgi:anti-sigma B factor antagonist